MYERCLKHNWSVRSELATLGVWVAQCLPGLRHTWQPDCCVALFRPFGSLQPQLVVFTFFLFKIPLFVSILSHFHSMWLRMLMGPSKWSRTHLSSSIPFCPLGLRHCVLLFSRRILLDKDFTFIHKCGVRHCLCAYVVFRRVRIVEQSS